MADKVKATWGLMKISPIQYNNYDVGPFEMVTDVLAGETSAQAFARAYAACEAMAKASTETKARQFKDAFEQANRVVKGR